MGMRFIAAGASRNAACALNAAQLRSGLQSYELCLLTKGQRLLSQLEPPM